ncbi:MAG: hypothetical protein RLZZ511_2529 [Cyanobacteriota bacterium]|jgi:uncharacterized protein
MKFAALESALTPRLRQVTQLPAPLRILIFVLLLLLLWAPYALLLNGLIADKNLVSLLTMPLIYLLFLGLAQIWSRWGRGEGNPLPRYGMRRRRTWLYELLGGLGIGYGFLLLVFELLGAIGVVRWFNPIKPMPWLLLEGLVIAGGVALAEEIFFRGWLLDELKRSYRPQVALAATSLIYAVLHYLQLSPMSLQWFALALLGWTLGLAKQVTGGRLGLSVGIHAGLVWCYYVLNVGRLFQFTRQTPLWVSGFGLNPLAGAIGITVMAMLAIAMTISVKRQTKPA